MVETKWVHVTNQNALSEGDRVRVTFEGEVVETNGGTYAGVLINHGDAMQYLSEVFVGTSPNTRVTLEKELSPKVEPGQVWAVGDFRFLVYRDEFQDQIYLVDHLGVTRTPLEFFETYETAELILDA